MAFQWIFTPIPPFSMARFTTFFTLVKKPETNKKKITWVYESKLKRKARSQQKKTSRPLRYEWIRTVNEVWTKFKNIQKIKFAVFSHDLFFYVITQIFEFSCTFWKIFFHLFFLLLFFNFLVALLFITFLLDLFYRLNWEIALSANKGKTYTKLILAGKQRKK